MSVKLNKSVQSVLTCSNLKDVITHDYENGVINMDEKDEYIIDLEEELENLTEHNRLLVERIKELEHEIQNRTTE